jgi:hypothetical protein
MGDYLNEMNRNGFGNAKVKSALKDLKDMHRNPLIHPEDSIESADDAIALMNSIHSVIVHMLKEMPVIATVPGVPPPGAAMPSVAAQQTSAVLNVSSGAQSS